MSEFYIGQVFKGEYPPAAAIWCNEEGNCYIEEIETSGKMRSFEIKAIPEPTDEELRQIEMDEIKNELNMLDLKSIRAIRSGDTEYIQKYEQEAVELRAKLADIAV